MIVHTKTKSDVFAATTRDVVQRAMARARDGFKRWRRLGPRKRRAALLNVKRNLYARRDELAALIRREVGKPDYEARLHEIFPALGHLEYFPRLAAKVLRTRTVRDRTLRHKRYRIERVPHGVVAILTPWNFPLLIPIGDLAAALAAGNAVIFKPSERCPRLGRAIASLFDSLPPGVFTLLEGGGRLGAALVRARPDAIVFTGGVRTGRQIAVGAAEQFVPCTLELGGKNAAIVLEDADLDRAADAVACAAFANAGQMCAAAGLALVSEPVHDAFVEKLVERAEALRLQLDPDVHGEIGRLLPPGAAARTLEWIGRAVDWGAQIACGGRLQSGRRGALVEPTVLTHVRPEMQVARVEIFGPVLPVIAVDGEDHAVRIANQGSLGLTGYVFSRSARRARRVAGQLDVGTVVVNDGPHTAGESSVPWGGVKDSGLGTVHGESGLLAMTRERVISEPLFRLPGGELWNFPYSEGKRRRVEGLTRLRHGSSILDRLGGLKDLLGF